MSIKAASNACKEGAMQQDIIWSPPAIGGQEPKNGGSQHTVHSGNFLVALHWHFGTLLVQLLLKYRSIAPQFIKHTAFEAPILQVVE